MTAWVALRVIGGIGSGNRNAKRTSEARSRAREARGQTDLPSTSDRLRQAACHWCHWCHVMERESFESPEIAALMNADFVSIKVDREERPDLDDVYMAAVQAMTGAGGWPMTVFPTPSLEPFFGGTYFPPEDRHGMSGLPRVLGAVANAYRTRRDEVEQQAGALADHLARARRAAGTNDVEPRQLEAAVARLAATFDAAHGGFGGAPKFPPPMVLEFLLRAWRRSRTRRRCGW